LTSFRKGSLFEKKVAAMLRKIDGTSRRNAGSHANWHRRSDVHTELPMHVECKDHKTIKVKEWFRQADAARAANQSPVVVFQSDEDVLCTLRFKDLLDLHATINDLHSQIAALRTPVVSNTDCTMCANGHPADAYGKCLQKGCPHGRGFTTRKRIMR